MTYSKTETKNHFEDVASYAFHLSHTTQHNLSKSPLDTHINGLEWYPKWLEAQFRALPSWIRDCVSSPSSIFKEIAYTTVPKSSIDDIATQLLTAGLVKSRNGQDERRAARAIAFAVLGWQTMLYQPEFGTCPPQQLAIADLMDGYNGQAFMKLRQDLSTVKRCLSQFLLGFGLMLPKENLCISEDKDDCQAFEKVDIISTQELNASLLQSIARINIQWVDVIAPHLELDKGTNTLYLFRHPSFCMANLSPPGGNTIRSMIFNCASQDDDDAQWASETDISQFLHEVLLSYRFLFGQAKESRKLFKEMNLFGGYASEGDDTILQQLCSSKTHQYQEFFEEREFYRLKRDFPILRSRIATLSYQMSNLKPRGWKEIWKDKRDSAQWLTFWAVMVIGGSGIALALVQVVLQAVALAKS